MIERTHKLQLDVGNTTFEITLWTKRSRMIFRSTFSSKEIKFKFNKFNLPTKMIMKLKSDSLGLITLHIIDKRASSAEYLKLLNSSTKKQDTVAFNHGKMDQQEMQH